MNFNSLTINKRTPNNPKQLKDSHFTTKRLMTFTTRTRSTRKEPVKRKTKRCSENKRCESREEMRGKHKTSTVVSKNRERQRTITFHRRRVMLRLGNLLLDKCRKGIIEVLVRRQNWREQGSLKKERTRQG